jgi:hypothetical protein
MADSRSNSDQEVGQTADLSRAELVENWRKMFQASPPRGIKRGLLERAHSYRLQSLGSGGLRFATRKRLLAIADSGGVARSASPESGDDPKANKRRRNCATLKPGTRLIREWNGTIHQVDVTESGFLWNSKTMKSLSAVARAITGARWSGPRFFGL